MPPKRRKQLGVTDVDYDRRLAAQGGGCAICGEPQKAEYKPGPWRCRYCKKHNQTAASGNVCSECGKKRPKTRRLDADHDHKTGRVRGLLCHRCNRALPSWVTAEWLRAATVYIGLTGDGRDYLAVSDLPEVEQP